MTDSAARTSTVRIKRIARLHGSTLVSASLTGACLQAPENQARHAGDGDEGHHAGGCGQYHRPRKVSAGQYRVHYKNPEHPVRQAVQTSPRSAGEVRTPVA